MTDETPQRHFRGCWFRVELFDLLREGAINAREAVLLMVIDSLVEVRGKDCYASNDYLGEQIGAGARNVRLMLAHLEELNLVRKTGFNGSRRTMVTAWSRVPQPLDQDRNKTTGQTGTKLPGRPEQNYRAINSSSNKKKKITPPQRDCAGERGGETSDSKRLHPRWVTLTQTLSKTLTTHHKMKVSQKDLYRWATCISRLHTENGYAIPRIEEALSWYCSQIRKGGLLPARTTYLPTVRSGYDFQLKFASIEAARERARADRKKERQRERGKPVGIKIVGAIDSSTWDPDEDIKRINS